MQPHRQVWLENKISSAPWELHPSRQVVADLYMEEHLKVEEQPRCLVPPLLHKEVQLFLQVLAVLLHLDLRPRLEADLHLAKLLRLVLCLVLDQVVV